MCLAPSGLSRLILPLPDRNQHPQMHPPGLLCHARRFEPLLNLTYGKARASFYQIASKLCDQLEQYR